MIDLAIRCREVLDWKRTGLLVDGELRRLASGMADIPERYRLDLAEKRTADEAMQFVIDANC